MTNAKAYSAQTIEEAYKLYSARMKLADIGAKLEVPESTLQGWSSRYKWKARWLQEAKKAGRLTNAAAHGQDLTDDQETAEQTRRESLTLTEQQSEYEEMSRAQALRFAAIIRKQPDSLILATADKIEKLDKIARKALKLETDKPPVAINIRLLASGVIQSRLTASAVPADEPLALVDDAGPEPATASDDDTSEG